VQLAKPALDVGLYTNNLEPMLEFWQTEAQLPYTEMLPVGDGLRQYRHSIGDSVLKVNHTRHRLAPSPAAGYRQLTIACDELGTATESSDPDGNAARFVPTGTDGITQLRLDLCVASVERHRAFYGDVLSLPEAEPALFEVGVSQISLSESDVNLDPEQRAPGYRYITMQVFDVKRTHADILAKGGREGMAPVKLGDIAHISFVRDPDGNWIEISQRKSIIGSLD
jgi:lactoylglutathione lyase|tara:strand:- start:5622 stop:6296 length:675 start_codon:yes stop_codon:yes gene_type:complete